MGKPRKKCPMTRWARLAHGPTGLRRSKLKKANKKLTQKKKTEEQTKKKTSVRTLGKAALFTNKLKKKTGEHKHETDPKKKTEDG